jgi:hypothetical protein
MLPPRNTYFSTRAKRVCNAFSTAKRCCHLENIHASRPCWFCRRHLSPLSTERFFEWEGRAGQGGRLPTIAVGKNHQIGSPFRTKPEEKLPTVADKRHVKMRHHTLFGRIFKSGNNPLSMRFYGVLREMPKMQNSFS